MKISSKLPQFDKGAALIAVAGTQEADFYLAENGLMNKVAHYKLIKTKYSDREDFGRRGSMVYESGARFESERIQVRKNFAVGFIDELKETIEENKISDIYLLAPSTILDDLIAQLSGNLKKKIKKTYPGNYHKKPMLDIIKKISRAF
jgi:protein required for attachment to host cells